MKKMLYVLFLLCFIPVLFKAQLPKLLEVPQTLPTKIKNEFVSKKSSLLIEKENLKQRISIHNEKCLNVPIESSLNEVCAAEQLKLNMDLATLSNEMTKFNNELNNTIESHNKFYSLLNDSSNQMVSLTAMETNDIGDRSAWKYSEIINQFDVEKSLRYKQQGEISWCNIFVCDVLRAMKAEIPVQSTESMIQWLNSSGKEKGWQKVSIEEIQTQANKGYPCLAITSGHAAIIRPGTPGESYGPALAQAGKWDINATHLKKRFYNSSRIEFWYHE